MTVGLGMKDEFVKSWVAIANYFKTCTLFGWLGTDWVGLFCFPAFFAISVCVLLLGVGVDTLGIPKERWYPNAGPWHTTKDIKETMTIHTPQITLESIDWLNYQGLAASFDNGDPS